MPDTSIQERIYEVLTSNEYLDDQFEKIKFLVSEAVIQAEKTELEFLERLKLEFDANVSQHAGERWDDSDAAILINERIAELRGESREVDK